MVLEVVEEAAVEADEVVSPGAAVAEEVFLEVEAAEGVTSKQHREDGEDKLCISKILGFFKL